MMVLVIGGTGRTGAFVLEEALARGHVVTALVRGADAADAAARLPAGVRERVGVRRGDVTDAAAVADAMAGCDAVISALGAGGRDRPGTALSEGTGHVVSAMRAGGVRRIVALVGAGVLQLDETQLRSDAPDYPERFRAIAREHRAVYDHLRTSGLDWTLVCTPNLVERPKTGRVRVADATLPEGGRTISCADVAAFLCEQLQDPTWIGKRVGLCE